MIDRQNIRSLCLGTAVGALLILATAAGLMFHHYTEYQSIFTVAEAKDSELIYRDERLAGQVYFSPEINRIRSELKSRPGDTELREKARQIELQQRRRYLTLKNRLEWGGWILLASGIVAIVGGLGAVLIQPYRPEIRSGQEPEAVLGLFSGRSLIVVSLLVIAVIAAAGYAGLKFGPAVTSQRLGLIKAPLAPIPAYTRSDPQPAWPRFQGEHGSGLTRAKNLPVEWSFVGNKNIRWQVELDLPAAGSPVVSGNRVVCIGANGAEQKIYCFDTDSGRKAWEQTVTTPASKDAQLELYDDERYGAGMFAASTPATDGERICVIFPSGDIAAYDFAGKQLWIRNIGPIDIQYGYASSLAIHEGRLAIQIDRGMGEENLSRLLLLDVKDGSTLAEVERPGAAGSWASPIVVPAPGGPQIIGQGNEMAIAHDAATGKELWRYPIGTGDQAPSPIWTGKHVVLTENYGRSVAIDPTGRGDLDGSDKVAWTIEEGNGSIPTPATDGRIIVQQDGTGYTTIRDAADGEQMALVELQGDCDPSPVIAGDRVYQFTTGGKCFVVQLAEQPSVIAENLLTGDSDDKMLSSPAFEDGRIYVRTLKTLTCIGESK
ncbi:MAG: PQQ-binding-like beta-propeller repeat protein [Planctomycetota bacterium]